MAIDAELTANLVKVGMAIIVGGLIGAGDLIFVMAATIVTLLVLLVFPKLEARIDRIREAREYQITVGASDHKKVESITALFDKLSLRVLEHHQAKDEKSIITSWKVIGSPGNHDKFVQTMMRDKSVKEMNY